MKKLKGIINVLILGDVMLDHYIYGEAKRLSQEAPIPIVKRNNERFILGGAANVAANLSQLGVKTKILGAIGNDDSAKILNSLLVEENIEAILENSLSCTTRKTRVVANNHQVVRVDQESYYDDEEKMLNIIKAELEVFDGELIIISDYNKGVCSERVCQYMIKTANSKGIKTLVDPKKNDWHKFKGAYLIKPNLSEFIDFIAFEKQTMNHNLIVSKGQQTIKQLGLKNLLVTRGSEGMSLISEDENQEIYAKKVDVFDVTGAGDTVIAILAFSLISGLSLIDSTKQANKASAFVVTKKNTYAMTKKEYEQYIAHNNSF